VKAREPPAKTFEFNVVKINACGRVISNTRQQAKYLVEDLGNGVTLEMVSIPAGAFLMGSPNNEAGREDREGPQHRVTLSTFWMSKFQITQAQWQAIMGTNPSSFKGSLQLPVESVSWDEANTFCLKLSLKTGKTYRLPSEAEWEYACRAGTTTPFYFGETITPELVNYDGNYNYAAGPKGVYREKTTPVGSFPPNDFGLFDMHGNVWEWCADVWHDNYHGAPTDGSVWETGGDHSYRLLRGGSWYAYAVWCRAAHRHVGTPDSRDDSIGLRVVRCAVWTS
jgi:formylglycine-generating enzyme required for sulfatase activity